MLSKILRNPPLSEGIIVNEFVFCKTFSNALYIGVNYIIYYTDLLSGDRTVAMVIHLA